MHKRIVKAIELALSQRGDDCNLMRIFVQSKETEGFWQMMIVPENGWEHLIPHIESIGIAIGRFYGEGLGVEKRSNYIIFS